MLNSDEKKTSDTKTSQHFKSFRNLLSTQLQSFKGTQVDSDSKSFMAELWDKCVKTGLPMLAVQTDWIQGIKNGNLNPDNYGRYTVQDIGYCQRAKDNWSTAADKAKRYDEDIYNYCLLQVSSMIKYTAELSNAWNVKSEDVVLGDALQQYMDYEEYIVNNYPPSYFPVAMFACYYLWPWVCQQIGPVEKNNLYYGWWYNNKSFHAGKTLAAKIDSLYKLGQIDGKTAFEIVSTCIKGETNFWRSACSQKLLNVTDECFVIVNGIKNGIWKFETAKQNVAKECYGNPQKFVTIPIDEQGKLLIINKSVVECDKPNTEEQQLLVGTAVTESYLDIRESDVYKGDLNAKNIMSYVLWHFEKTTYVFKSKREFDINKKYAGIDKMYAKVKIMVNQDLSIEITAQSGWNHWLLVCIGAWWLGQCKNMH
eukprot:305929_1